MLHTNNKVYYIRHFAHFRKASIGFVMAVRPSTSNNSASIGRILKNDIFVLYKNVEKLHVWLNSGSVMGTSNKDKGIHVATLQRTLLKKRNFC